MHQTGGGVRTAKATWPAAYRITEFERPIAAASDHLHKWLLIGVATSALEAALTEHPLAAEPRRSD